MKKKILIFGLGSIGIKHANLLRKIVKTSNILFFSKRKSNQYLSTNSYLDIISFNPDYILVCSETSKHYEHLCFIEKNFKNKNVLVEKPLFHKVLKLNLKRNKYFIGYNLRFHPVINFLKKIIKKKNIFNISIFCNTYLPYWRKNIKYFNSYSASKKKGGGVLLDLSHEFDYIQWLFGKIDKIEFKKIKKISFLKINTEDTAQIIGKIKNINCNFNLNYFSRFEQRQIIIDSKKETIVGDLKNFSVEIFSKKKQKIIQFKKNLDKTYLDQHLLILKKKTKALCQVKDGKQILSLIDELKK